MQGVASPVLCESGGCDCSCVGCGHGLNSCGGDGGDRFRLKGIFKIMFFPCFCDHGIGIWGCGAASFLCVSSCSHSGWEIYKFKHKINTEALTVRIYFGVVSKSRVRYVKIIISFDTGSVLW